MRQGNQKAAPVSLVSVVTEDDHEINMQLPWAANTQQAAEEQTRQQRFLRGQPVSKKSELGSKYQITYISPNRFSKNVKNQSTAENVKQSRLLYEARAGYTTARRETPKIKVRDTRTA